MSTPKFASPSKSRTRGYLHSWQRFGIWIKMLRRLHFSGKTPVNLIVICSSSSSSLYHSLSTNEGNKAQCPILSVSHTPFISSSLLILLVILMMTDTDYSFNYNVFIFTLPLSSVLFDDTEERKRKRQEVYIMMNFRSSNRLGKDKTFVTRLENRKKTS